MCPGEKIFKIYETQIADCNILRVSAGTNGFCGGDAGHGSRTFIEIEDLGGTDIECQVGKDGKSIEIRLGGDAELRTIINALDWIFKTLSRQAHRDRGDAA